MERITVDGTVYQVVRREPTADVMPGTFSRILLDKLQARGRIYLLKARGTHLYRGTEYSDGRIGAVVDTHTTLTGRGVR
jgi:hypothetical protein